jgi:hypothetical protein
MDEAGYWHFPGFVTVCACAPSVEGAVGLDVIIPLAKKRALLECSRQELNLGLPGDTRRDSTLDGVITFLLP